MKNTKRQFKTFSFFDFDGITAHMEKMAADGWMLEQSTNRYWIYRRTEPKKLKFAVTYFPQASEFDPHPTEELQAFNEFCQSAGWKPAASMAQMQIFYNENEDPIPIETDPMVQVDTIHKAMKKNFIPSSLLMIAVSLMILCMNVAKFIASPVSVLSSNADFFVSFSYIMLFLISAVEMGQYYIWRKKAIQLAEEGLSIPSGKTAKLFQTVVLAVMLIMLVIYAVMSLGIISPWLLFTIFAIFGGSGVAAFYLKEFLRKKNVSRHLNMALTFGTIIAVTIFMVFILVWAAVNYDLPTSPKDSKPVGSYTTPQGFEFDIYDDEVPLRIEDFMQTDYTDYSVRNRASGSIMLSVTEVHQDATVNRQGVSELIYEITEVKFNPVYDMCFDDIFYNIDDSKDKNIPEEYKAKLVEQTDSAWKADKVYRVFYENEYQNKWLVCWDNKIVEMRFYNCGELTDSQKAVIGEKMLNSKGVQYV